MFKGLAGGEMKYGEECDLSPESTDAPENMVCEEKRVFVKQRLLPLIRDCDLGVDNVEYERAESGEFVVIRYFNGRAERINVTADSLAALARDVLKRWR